MASKDYAHIQTDEELAALEARIAEVYGDAASEMRATVNDYFDSYAQRYEQYIKEYNAGNITKEEFQQWELNQIGRGERYEAMANALANRFVNADEVAMSYVNDATPSIYSLNRNYSNYAINQLDPSIDFSLWDESTVRNLLVNQPNLMPYYPQSKAIKRGIDLNYGKQQIRKSVTSGILQGKSLSRIARDLMNRIQGMSLASALRSARTAITAAENAGRQDSYDEAADMGLKMEKVWLATLDGRTRIAHQQADFQVVKYDEMFDVGGESLMYPGDASHGASGWNLYNCRCTMFEKPEGMSMDDFERWARDPETGDKEKVTGESYEDWLKSKEQQQRFLKDATNDGESSELKTVNRNESSLLNGAKNSKINYNKVDRLATDLSSDEIIKKVSGGDQTNGSCASAALAYAANKNGLDVLDFRGGSSQEYFSEDKTVQKIAKMTDVQSTTIKAKDENRAVNQLFNKMESGKEYLLSAGEHMAVVRNNGSKQYLELQSPVASENKWTTIRDNNDLTWRFGTTKNSYAKTNVTMIDIDSLKGNSAFEDLMGYINTPASQQQKGASGSVK